MSLNNSNHIVWLNWAQTSLFVDHSLSEPSGQSDLLLNWNKALKIVDQGGVKVKEILLTRLDTFRFWNLPDEAILRLIRHEIMQDWDIALDKKNIEIINQSLSRAVAYLNDKWYPIPRNIPPRFNTEEAIMVWIKTQRKSKEWYVTRNLCRYLQTINAYHTLLSTPWVSINEKGDIDLRDVDLMKKIMGLFSRSNFRYTDESNKFSRTSKQANGSFIISGEWDWHIPFYARFRLKDEKRWVQKFIQSPEYDAKALIKDEHGMRIEVTEPAHAFKMMEYLLWNMKLNMDTLEIKNRNMATLEEWDRWCSKWHFWGPYRSLMNSKAKFWAQKKAVSTERRELKFSCWKPSFEVQFVLVNNTNEAAYAHHDIYACVCDIFEKIRFDGYCNDADIEHFISLYIDENSLKEIGLNKQNIKAYILSKLIPIRFWDAEKKKPQFTTIASVFRMAMGDLADIRTCKLEFPTHTKKFDAKTLYGEYAGKSVYIKDLKFTAELMSLIDDEIDEYGTAWEETIVVFSWEASNKTSSKLPIKGQWFVMDAESREVLDGVIERVKATIPSQ